MKAVGNVEIPQDAFLAVLKWTKNNFEIVIHLIKCVLDIKAKQLN